MTSRCDLCGREYPTASAISPGQPHCPSCAGANPSGTPSDVPSRSASHAIEAISPPIAPGLSPPPTAQAPRPVGPGSARLGVFQESQVRGLAWILIALSIADIFMTFTLLRTSPRFIESNPIATWFFTHWDMSGMVLFKFGMIAGVIVIAEFIERRRPRWGRAVLLIACCATAYAVYVGLGLSLRAHGPEFISH